MKKLLVPLLTLVLLGAGCGAAKPESKPEEKPTPAPAVQPKPETTPPTPSPSAEARVITGAETDGTWKVYSNSALGFSFMWPTKGRYAPTWEVDVDTVKDPANVETCIELPNTGEVRDTSRVTVGDTVFCHLGTVGTGDEIIYFDNYATVIGTSLVKIQFQKRVYAASDCSKPYSVTANSCAPFDGAEYDATLDGIVGTFKLTK